MKSIGKIALVLLMTALTLYACGQAAQTPPVLKTQPAILSPVVPTDRPTLTPSATPPTGALIHEVKGIVEARDPAQAEFEPARDGRQIAPLGQVRTGEDGRARLDLVDGTFVRVGPSSLFTLESDEPGKSKLELLFGQLWVILNGGELTVRTPSGTASVRGSFMSVAYDPESGRTYLTCLEGTCAAQSFTQTCELIAGQAAEIMSPEEMGAGGMSIVAELMTERDLAVWMEFIPEAEAMLPIMQATRQAEPELPGVIDLPFDRTTPYPTPESTPEPPVTYEPPPTLAPTLASVSVPYLACLETRTCLSYCPLHLTECGTFESSLSGQGVNIGAFWTCFNQGGSAQYCADTSR